MSIIETDRKASKKYLDEFLSGKDRLQGGMA